MNIFPVVNIGIRRQGLGQFEPLLLDTVRRLCEAVKDYHDWSSFQDTAVGRRHQSDAVENLKSIIDPLPPDDQEAAIKQLRRRCPGIDDLLAKFRPPAYPFFTPTPPPSPMPPPYQEFPPGYKEPERKPVATGEDFRRATPKRRSLVDNISSWAKLFASRSRSGDSAGASEASVKMFESLDKSGQYESDVWVQVFERNPAITPTLDRLLVERNTRRKYLDLPPIESPMAPTPVATPSGGGGYRTINMPGIQWPETPTKYMPSGAPVATGAPLSYAQGQELMNRFEVGPTRPTMEWDEKTKTVVKVCPPGMVIDPKTGNCIWGERKPVPTLGPAAAAGIPAPIPAAGARPGMVTLSPGGGTKSSTGPLPGIDSRPSIPTLPGGTMPPGVAETAGGGGTAAYPGAAGGMAVSNLAPVGGGVSVSTAGATCDTSKGEFPDGKGGCRGSISALPGLVSGVVGGAFGGVGGAAQAASFPGISSMSGLRPMRVMNLR